jgi:hypothetical protein
MKRSALAAVVNASASEIKGPGSIPARVNISLFSEKLSNANVRTTSRQRIQNRQ